LSPFITTQIREPTQRSTSSALIQLEIEAMNYPMAVSATKHRSQLPDEPCLVWIVVAVDF